MEMRRGRVGRAPDQVRTGERTAALPSRVSAPARHGPHTHRPSPGRPACNPRVGDNVPTATAPHTHAHSAMASTRKPATSGSPGPDPEVRGQVSRAPEGTEGDVLGQLEA